MNAASEKRPLVGLGDLIRAAVQLDASPEECVRIAALLDLRHPSIPRPPPSRRDRKIAFTEAQATRRQETRNSPAPTEAQTADGATSAGTMSAELFDLAGPTKSNISGLTLPGGIDSIDLAPSAMKPPRYEPLLSPSSARNILSATLSIEDEQGPIDAARLIDAVASCRAVARLVREPSPTLRRGALVLIDRSEHMDPYHRDIVEVLRSIEQVLGRDGVTRFTFDGAPTELARWDDGEPCAFSAPAGTPVLLLSDLGMRRSSSEDDWYAFATRAARAGCLLIALVPYPPSRLPARLARRMRVVMWDRRTTVAEARHAARKMGLRV